MKLVFIRRGGMVVCSFALAIGVLTAASQVATAATKLSGSPIKIGVVADVGAPGNDHPEILAGAKAAAAYLNTVGGISGRPVEAVTCNAQGDPVLTKECAQQFVADGVVAVGGESILFPTTGLPVLEAAHIPFIGFAISDSDFLSPVSYPMFSNVATGYVAAENFMLSKGVKKISVVYIDVAEALAVAQQKIQQPLAKKGVSVQLLPSEPGAADFTPVVAKALQSKPGGIFMLLDEADSARVAETAVQSGYKGWFQTSQVGTTYAKSPTAVLSKTIVPIATDIGSSNPDFKIFKKAIDKYATGSTVNGNSSASFAEFMTLQTVCKSGGASHCTAAGLVKVLSAPHNIPIFLGKALDVSTRVSWNGQPSNLYNPWIKLMTENHNATFTNVTGWVGGKK